MDDPTRYACATLHEARARVRRAFRVAPAHRRVAKWYSAIGNEAISVPAGLALEPGTCSARCTATWGRSSPSTSIRRAPSPASASARRTAGGPTRGAVRTAGAPGARARGGFSRGRALLPLRLLRADEGLLHSHDQPPGRHDPVAAGCAFALQRHGTDAWRSTSSARAAPRPGTSTRTQPGGGVEAAAGARDREQTVRLLDAGAPAVRLPAAVGPRPGYGIPSETVDGNDPDHGARARDRGGRARTARGDAARAMVGRLRGHARATAR